MEAKGKKSKVYYEKNGVRKSMPKTARQARRGTDKKEKK